jgi:hypothetical protein
MARALTMAYSLRMKDGALVLVDCLGFRGIWNRVNPEELIGRLKSIETKAAARVVPKYSSSMLSFGPVRFHLRLLSDTVVLSIQYEPSAYADGAEPDERQKNLLVSVACESASVLAYLFMDSEMPLPLRGCVSFGPHLCDGNFLIGPAVDQAAEYMNEPEGAFIWALPAVAERHKSFRARCLAIMELPNEMIMAAHRMAAERGADAAEGLLKHPEAGSDLFVEALRLTYAQILATPTIMENYPMPIKRGSVIDAAIINPFISARNEEDRKRIMNRYDQFLKGDRIDIWMKRQNTLKFLALAEKASAEFRQSLGSGDLPQKSQG